MGRAGGASPLCLSGRDYPHTRLVDLLCYLRHWAEANEVDSRPRPERPSAITASRGQTLTRWNCPRRPRSSSRDTSSTTGYSSGKDGGRAGRLRGGGCFGRDPGEPRHQRNPLQAHKRRLRPAQIRLTRRARRFESALTSLHRDEPHFLNPPVSEGWGCRLRGRSGRRAREARSLPPFARCRSGRFVASAARSARLFKNLAQKVGDDPSGHARRGPRRVARRVQLDDVEADHAPPSRHLDQDRP